MLAMKRARPLTPERLDRLMRWSQLWLLRLAAWLVHNGWLAAPVERALEHILKPKLVYMARGICMLIAAKAVLAAPHVARKAGGKPPSTRIAHIRRSAIGARLRKLVRARDLRARIAALLMLLQNAEKEIARIAQRLKHGLSRRRGSVALASFDQKAVPTAPRIALSKCNSS
jgi:hypothetical protein